MKKLWLTTTLVLHMDSDTTLLKNHIKMKTNRNNVQAESLSPTLHGEESPDLEAEIAELRRENARLTQQVHDDAIELQATVDEFNRAKAETERAKEETERARVAAERANSVKSAFLASMSHELRTPLNAIINFTKFVAKGTMGPVNDEQRDSLNQVIRSSVHLLNLINDVLDMSKIEAGSLTLFIEDKVELLPIIETVIANGKSLAADKPVTVRAEVADDLHTISGDRQRIFQILLNLISNASKYVDEGAVTLRAYNRSDEVVFEIEDTGPGIAPEDQAKVFEAFKQTEIGLRRSDSTGLGMPISKSLAEAHGGRIWLESEIGRGSTFYVVLPIKPTVKSEPSGAN